MKNLLIYMTCLVGYLVIKLAATTLLLAMVAAPPLLIQWTFPVVHGWWVQQDNALVESAGFLALIGVLGLVPYLFIKSAERIPGALKAIIVEFQAVLRDPWLPQYSKPTSLSPVVTARTGGLGKAMVAGWSFMVSLTTSAAIVMLAGALATPAVARVTIRTSIEAPDGSTHLETNVHQLVAEDQMTVDVFCTTEPDQTCMPSVNTLIVSQPRPFDDD